MAPSTALQSRINAFESLGGPSVLTNSPSSNPLDSPISPTAKTISPIVPSPSQSRKVSPSPSPPNLGRKTSLIDLKDWVVDDGPTREKRNINGNGYSYMNGRGSHKTGIALPGLTAHSKVPVRPKTAPLINFESAVKAPPLPPRKPSQPANDSLTVDNHHTYPPLSKLDVSSSAININDRSPNSKHVPASSVSSFHSISLSSDGGSGTDTGTPTSLSNFIPTYPMDRDDVNSLDGSYENVSTTSTNNSPVVVAISHDWDAKRPEPPKLPRRPQVQRTFSASTSVSATPISSPAPSLPTSPRLLPTHSTSSTPPSSSSFSRRAPPPPPPRSRPPSSRTSIASFASSDRSSILSTTSRTSVSTFSSTNHNKQLVRPTPIPPNARQRYEKVFLAAFLQSRLAANADNKSPSPPHRKPRTAAGWRGLSVDLITNPPEQGEEAHSDERENEELREGMIGEERLDGTIVKRIWLKSKLDRRKLRDVWTECDPTSTGTVDRDAFVKGMWRIDEELRRAQLHSMSSPPSRSKPKLKSKPDTKLILR